jgi:hypothetical protein
VSRIWRANGLKPHRVDSFKVSNDPLFADKLEAIVGLYLNPTRTPNPSSGLQKLTTSSKRSPALRPHSINDDLGETLH